jgi:hypothetical protein
MESRSGKRLRLLKSSPPVEAGCGARSSVISRNACDVLRRCSIFYATIELRGAGGRALAGPLDEQAIIAAFLRTRTLGSSNEKVTADEARKLELLLRPTALLPAVQQVVVPMLDRAELFSLAMAWDSKAQPAAPPWLFARAERWLKLRAPEHALVTLAELKGAGASIDEAKARALQSLATERKERHAVLAPNLHALFEIDPRLHAALQRHPRTTVTLRPLGAGLAEFGGAGAPLAQIWAPTPDEALAAAAVLVQQCDPATDCFVAGVGDGSLPSLALGLLHEGKERCVHLIEPSLSRLRALLEIVDMSAPVRTKRMRVHAGIHAIESLAAAFPQGLHVRQESVVGGDTLATSVIRLAEARVNGTPA